MTAQKHLLLLLSLVWLLVGGSGAAGAFAGDADTITGRIVNVIDGDSVLLMTPERVRHRVRLYGIDAPEIDQAFGADARRFVLEAVRGQTVVLRIHATDRWGRLVADVLLPGGQSLNAALVGEGLAWVWPLYCRRSKCIAWSRQQAAALEAGRGLWADPAPMEPWEYRRAR